MKIKVSPYVEERIQRKKSDFRVDTFRSGGPGGQAQNKRDTGVRITDTKTGISAESRSATGQDDNKKLAFQKLVTKLVEYYHAQEVEQIVKHREAERAVRTYNVKRNQVVDHRTNMSYSLTQILDGALDQMLADCKSVLVTESDHEV